MATVYVPSLMRGLARGQAEVKVQGSTVRQIIDNLEQVYPGMKLRLVEGNRIKPNLSVAVDGEVTPLGMLAKVGEQSEVHFLPAIGGGQRAICFRWAGCRHGLGHRQPSKDL